MDLHVRLEGRGNLARQIYAQLREAILSGYGAIATSKIDEGLRRLRECFVAGD